VFRLRQTRLPPLARGRSPTLAGGPGVLLVGAGGSLGAVCRYLVGGWATDRLGSAFPYATLLVNASGSFLLGLVLTAVSRRTKPSDGLRLLVAVGFLGAYTTFSTFSVETLSLLQQQAYLTAALNVGGSVALAMLAVACGALVGRWL